MRSVATLIYVVVYIFPRASPATLYPETPLGEVVSAKLEGLQLTVRWNNSFTAIATLNNEQKNDCIFPGYFLDDLSSNVLVTGCPSDDLSVQFQSRKFGDWLLTVTKEGEIVPLEEDDYHSFEDDDFLVNPDAPEVAAISNGRVKRNDYEDYDVFEHHELYDLEEYELKDEDLPSKVELQVSVYLDPNWRKLHGLKSEQLARQILTQASLLMVHSSLNTKIELVHGNRFYNSSTHIKFSDQRQATNDIYTNLPKLLKQPFNIGGHPVCHVYMTVPDSPRRVNGVAEIGKLCPSEKYKNRPKFQPKAIITWNNNAATSAVTMSHQIGHIFGMYHDFSKKGITRTEPCAIKGEGKFIMNYKRRNAPLRTVWSGCSNDDFRDYYWKMHVTHGKFCLKEENEELADCDALTQFQCFSGICIPESKRCDFSTLDCPLGEDEADCPWK